MVNQAGNNNNNNNNNNTLTMFEKHLKDEGCACPKCDQIYSSEGAKLDQAPALLTCMHNVCMSCFKNLEKCPTCKVKIEAKKEPQFDPKMKKIIKLVKEVWQYKYGKTNTKFLFYPHIWKNNSATHNQKLASAIALCYKSLKLSTEELFEQVYSVVSGNNYDEGMKKNALSVITNWQKDQFFIEDLEDDTVGEALDRLENSIKDGKSKNSTLRMGRLYANRQFKTFEDKDNKLKALHSLRRFKDLKEIDLAEDNDRGVLQSQIPYIVVKEGIDRVSKGNGNLKDIEYWANAYYELTEAAFAQIDPQNVAQGKKDDGLNQLANLSNQIRKQINEMLEGKDKETIERIFTFILRVADKCRKLGDYNSMMNIALTLKVLNKFSLKALKEKSNALKINGDEMEIFEKLIESSSPSKNFQNYRNEIEKDNHARLPFAPFLSKNAVQVGESPLVINGQLNLEALLKISEVRRQLIKVAKRARVYNTHPLKTALFPKEN